MPVLRFSGCRLGYRPRWGRRLLCACLVAAAVGGLALWVFVRHVTSGGLWCSEEASRAYLDYLCSGYLDGRVAGSLCKPLCVTKEIEFTRCLGHGVKAHVLQAEWRGRNLVLKSTKPIREGVLATNFENETNHRKMTKAQFIRDANMSVFLNLAGRRSVPFTGSVLETIFSECDLLEDGLLTHTEALVCWQLLETNEYMLYSLLAGNTAIPDVYGVCGNMYAVQYASSDPLTNSFSLKSDRRSWQLKVKLALALLEMVRNIEATPYGTLYLCDVQPSNFGVVRDKHSGQLVAKATDVDISWFTSGLASAARFEENNTCQRDEDCDFVSCHVPCNLDRHTCSGHLTSSNLQVVCERLFLSHYWWGPALLRDPPPSLVPQLQPLLKECLSPALPQPHLNIQLLHQLTILLRDSISTT